LEKCFFPLGKPGNVNGSADPSFLIAAIVRVAPHLALDVVTDEIQRLTDETVVLSEDTIYLVNPALSLRNLP
jgi:hypothetical protein